MLFMKALYRRHIYIMISHHRGTITHTSTDFVGFIMPIIALCLGNLKLFIHFVLILCVLCVVSDRLQLPQCYGCKSSCHQVNIYICNEVARSSEGQRFLLVVSEGHLTIMHNSMNRVILNSAIFR